MGAHQWHKSRRQIGQRRIELIFPTYWWKKTRCRITTDFNRIDNIRIKEKEGKLNN